MGMYDTEEFINYDEFKPKGKQMQIHGKVISVEIDIQVPKKDGGVYPGARLTYRDETDAIKDQAFHNNAFKYNAPLKAQLLACKTGDAIVIEKEKKGEFWNVVSIFPEGQQAVSSIPTNSTAAQNAPMSKAYSTPKSTYETPEERAQKQKYIVRQSTINLAISTLTVGSKAVNDKEVLVLAKKYENYVFDKGLDNNGPEAMEDDLGDVIQ